MTVLLIDNYDSFTYNLYQLLQAQTEATVEVVRNDALTIEQFLERSDITHVILSPGPGNPDTPSDFGICADVIRTQEQHQRKILGVCLGHQGLSSQWGGKVIGAGAIVHGKTSKIEVLDEACPLFVGLPRPFEAMRYHSLVVEEASLPLCLKVTAKDLTHGLVMGVQHESLPLYGVQFHPESIGTPQGSQLLHNFLTLC